MALRELRGDQVLAVNDADGALHLASRSGDGTLTSIQEITVGTSSFGTLLDVLAINTITVTAASATLQALLTTADGALNANVKRISLKPAGAVSMALGGAAVLGVNVLDAAVWISELACKLATDLRFIAGGNVAMVVVQEG